MSTPPPYVNLRSSLATDPVRNFRFLAKFTLLTTDQRGIAAGAGFSNSTFTANLGFTQISGLTVTTESIPYREGGYNTNVHQIPGQTSFSPLTFTRGVVINTSQNWQWMKQLFNVAGGTGSGEFRCQIDISVLHHPTHGSGDTQFNTVTGSGDNIDANGVEVATKAAPAALKFRVYNAWITSVAYSDLNAGDNALMVEQMSVVHEGFDMLWSEAYGATKESTFFSS